MPTEGVFLLCAVLDRILPDWYNIFTVSGS